MRTITVDFRRDNGTIQQIKASHLPISWILERASQIEGITYSHEDDLTCYRCGKNINDLPAWMKKCQQCWRDTEAQLT